MRGDGDPSVIVIGEDVVEDGFRAGVLSAGRLGDDA
jgi:hypothetical protein